MSDEPGFFRNLAGYATEWVTQKRRNLAPITDVDKAGGKSSYSFDGQEFDHSDLREVKHIRESGGQVATLMETKALLNFGEGVEIHVDTSEDEEPPTEIVDGEELTLSEYLHQQFPALDLLVLNLGEDALYYPYATAELRENRAGEFKDLLPAEPWTLVPKTNRKGEIQAWIQETRQNGTRKTQTLNPDDIVHFVLNKNSARDSTGISEILRNKDEIDAFKANQEAISQAIELHGFPQRHIKVGRENGAPVNDDELRRVRQIFDPQSTDANTAYFSGQDVSVETLEAHNFDYTAIHEMDMRNLTTALGLPLELGNVGADGLGSGKPAELRLAMLKLSIKANQRRFAQQFVEKVFRPVIEQYSPFDADADIRLEFGDPLEDIGDMADVITSVGEYMTNAEVREKLDLPAPDDDEIADGYRTPADIEAPEEETGGGLFGEAAEQAVDQELDKRDLAVPDNAVSISDRSEAPEGASIITGDRGGLYYIPAGEGGSNSDGETISPDEVTDTSQIQAENIEFDTEDVGDENKVSFHAMDDEIQFDMGVPKDGDSAMAYHLFIDEQHRGEGVASELMKAAEMKAREEGMDNLNASVGGDPDAAEAFYESLGFEEGIIDDGELIKPDGGWTYYHKPLDDDREAGRDTDFRRLKDVEDIDTGDYPQAAVKNARMALDAKEATGNPNDCGTQVGWERANQLDNGEDLSEDTINRMAQFARHESNYDPEAEQSDCGWMMWKAWGGKEGIEWAQDKVEEFENARENAAPEHMQHLSDYPEWERALLELEHGIHDIDTETRVLSFTQSQTPQFVLDRIKDVIQDEGLFSDIESIQSGDRMQLREFFTETLAESQGWTIDGLADQIEQLGVAPDDAETIARTETHQILADTREVGYQEQGLAESEEFYWSGAIDNRTTDACRWLIAGADATENISGNFKGTNPFHGGKPRPMDELKELVKEAARKDPDINTAPREWTPHINCRKTFVRAVPGMLE